MTDELPRTRVGQLSFYKYHPTVNFTQDLILKSSFTFPPFGAPPFWHLSLYLPYFTPRTNHFHPIVSVPPYVSVIVKSEGFLRRVITGDYENEQKFSWRSPVRVRSPAEGGPEKSEMKYHGLLRCLGTRTGSPRRLGKEVDVISFVKFRIRIGKPVRNTQFCLMFLSRLPLTWTDSGSTGPRLTICRRDVSTHMSVTGFQWHINWRTESNRESYPDLPGAVHAPPFRKSHLTEGPDPDTRRHPFPDE